MIRKSEKKKKKIKFRGFSFRFNNTITLSIMLVIIITVSIVELIMYVLIALGVVSNPSMGNGYTDVISTEEKENLK